MSKAPRRGLARETPRLGTRVIAPSPSKRRPGHAGPKVDGERLGLWRKLEEVSQATVAKALHCEPTTISKMERKGEAGWPLVKRLIEYMREHPRGLSPEEFVPDFSRAEQLKSYRSYQAALSAPSRAEAEALRVRVVELLQSLPHEERPISIQRDVSVSVADGENRDIGILARFDAGFVQMDIVVECRAGSHVGIESLDMVRLLAMMTGYKRCILVIDGEPSNDLKGACRRERIPLITLEQLAAEVAARTKQVAKDRLQRAAGPILLRPDWRRKQVEEAVDDYFEARIPNTHVLTTWLCGQTKLGAAVAHASLLEVGESPSDLARSLRRALGADFEALLCALE